MMDCQTGEMVSERSKKYTLPNMGCNGAAVVGEMQTSRFESYIHHY